MIGFALHNESIADCQSVPFLTIIECGALLIILMSFSIVSNIELKPHVFAAKEYQKSMATVEIKSSDASMLKDGSTKHYAAEII